MEFIGILLIAVFALIVGSIFFYVFRSTGPWGSFWSFLLILILVGLAADAWITPVGPYYQGVSWIPVMFVILLFALFIAAATPVRRRPAKSLEAEIEEEETARIAFGGFFWVLMVFLFIAAIWGLFV